MLYNPINSYNLINLSLLSNKLINTANIKFAYQKF